jgi:peptide subunit release factor 1 (eRF1)
LARFVVDPAVATADQVRRESERLLAEYSRNRRQALIREVLGETRRNGRGALGLNRVLLALETGEMQTLLLSENFAAPGARCTNCGHLDARMVPNCAVCGQPTVEVEDLADVLLSEAIRNGIEVVYVTSEPELSRYDGIGALLRFRADQNTEAKKAG